MILISSTVLLRRLSDPYIESMIWRLSMRVGAKQKGMDVLLEAA